MIHFSTERIQFNFVYELYKFRLLFRKDLEKIKQIDEEEQIGEEEQIDKLLTHQKKEIFF